MRRIRYSISLLLFLSFSGAAYSQQKQMPAKHEFSLQQTVDYALKNNVAVKNSLQNIKVQQEQVKQVQAAAYPHVNASLGTTYNPAIATQVIPDFISPATYGVLSREGVRDGSGNPIQVPNDFGIVAAQFGTKFSANAGVALNQILFDGQVFVGLLARGSVIKMAKKTAEVTAENIKANIHKVYYQLVVSKEQVDMLDAVIVLTEKNLRDTRIIYENGFREKLDVDKETVRLANLQTEKQKILNQISNGFYGLKLLIGMPIKDDLVLTDKVTDDQIKDGMLDAMAYQYEDRKDFQQIQIAKQLSEYNVRRYKLSQIPSVSLSALYAKNAQRDKWNFFGRGNWFSIANINLNVSIPIFNGFFTKSKIQEAKIEVDKINNQIEALKLWIDNDAEAAKNNYKNAVATMDFQKKNMQLAETIYQQTKKKYEVGTGTQIEIVAAQTEMKSAQTNYIAALYDAVIAKVDYLVAIGKL